MSEFVIPDKVKEILSRLPVADQVVLRGYIAGMRDMAKEYKAKAEHGEHAHFHGDEICTTNHGHNHEHADEEMACDGNHDHGHAHGHDHKDEGMACDGNHDHGHAHGHDHKESHSHGGENKHGHEKESHAHEHKHQEHAHDHDHKKKEDDIPAWKKRALESGGDASAAPFGGSWNTESSLDATKK